MLYTDKVKADLRTIKCPVDLTVDIVEYHEKPPFLALRFYESQWVHLSEQERHKVALYFTKVKAKLLEHGIPSTLEPIADRT